MINFEYKRYPSIPNTYQEKVLQYIELHGYAHEQELWSVTEKIHGANLTAYVNHDNVQWANRTAFINDSFYGLFNGLSEKITPNLKALYTLISSYYEDDFELDYIIVYGELFGGAYPHQDVEKLKNVSKVQARIWYSPDVEFAGFDIFVIAGDNKFFVPMDLVFSSFESSGVFYSKELFRGTLKQAMEQDDKFNSHIATDLGYPELDDNTGEGLVIKPVVARHFPSGSRVILKAKNIKFTEKKDKVEKERKPMSEEQLEALEIAETYITDNRLDNVLSKTGDVITNQLIGKYIRLLVQDAIEELNKESDCMTKLDKAEIKPITKSIQDDAKRLVLARVEYAV